MRVLLVTSPAHPAAVGHANALTAAGLSVDVVGMEPGRFSGLAQGIGRHIMDAGAPTQPGRVGRVGRVAAAAAGPVDRAAFRTTARAARAAARLTGGRLDPDLPSRWRPAPSGLGDREAIPDALRTLAVPSGLVPDEDALASLRAALAGRDGWARFVADVIEEVQPDVVDAGPMMIAGPVAWGGMVLAAAGRPAGSTRPRWAVGDWGADLRFLAHVRGGAALARGLLTTADGFLAECADDRSRARELGHRGPELAALPLDGGLDVTGASALTTTLPSSRRVVLVDGGQGLTERGLVALEAVRRCADLLTDHEVIVHGDEGHVRVAVRGLLHGAGLRVTVREPDRAPGPPAAGHRPWLLDHGRARVSIRLSLGEAVGGWVQASMALGALPIRAATACAGDHGDGAAWDVLRAHPDEPEEVATALRRALVDDDLVDRAAVHHRRVADDRFERSAVTAHLGSAMRVIAGSPP